MAWTDPDETKFQTGDIPTEGDILTSILDNLTMLGAGAAVTHSANQTFTSATYTSIAFDTERYDPSAFHSNVTNNSRLTVPSGLGGRYMIRADLSITGAGLGCSIRLIVNATTVLWEGSSITSLVQSSRIYALAAGDFVELQIKRDDLNPTVSKISNTSPEFAIQGLGGTT